MQNAPAISLHGLTKSYGSVQALRGIDLEVAPGAIFGFLGPNGAGKTTTIRCLLDLIRPNSGVARVLGIDPQADPVTVRARTGYLPGEFQVDGDLTGDQALRFFAALRPNKIQWAFVRQLAARLDLDLSRKIKNLSKGNKQKVGVVQALMHRPELLLLDEPTSGLDPLMQQEVLSLLREANTDGATVFFSSHIMSEVEVIAGQVAIIRTGKVVEVAATADMVRRSLRRATVRFRQPVDSSSLSALPGISVLSADATSVVLQVEGEMDALIKTLASFPVADLETARPSLEEVFLTYYKNNHHSAEA